MRSPIRGASPISLCWNGSIHQIPRKFGALDGAMLFALQIALSSTWRAWGIAPDLVLGIGRGEVAAAQVAGLISLEDGLKLAWQARPVR